MKILTCVAHEYYSLPGTVNDVYIYFVECLREMGHIVHYFDYVHQDFDRESMNEFFLSIVKDGGYDLVWMTRSEDEFFPEVLDEAKKHAIILSWNSDDDVRWKDYSSKWYSHFTYMVTTYRHIYEANKEKYPNLLLSQWGCTGHYEGLDIKKDIDYSFVGRIYKGRAQEIRKISKSIPMKIYSKDKIQSFPEKFKRKVAKVLDIPWENKKLALPDEKSLKGIWNRTKISYTPLGSWTDTIQVKARLFDMGLSGTVMLCDKNQDLYEFYEPGKEFVEFEDAEDFISKAKYIIKHDSVRKKIAKAYYKRTKAEHLLYKRFESIFAEIGLDTNRNREYNY